MAGSEVTNETPVTYQLQLDVGQEQITGRILADAPPAYQYQLANRGLAYIPPGRHGVGRGGCAPAGLFHRFRPAGLYPFFVPQRLPRGLHAAPGDPYYR